MSLRVGFRGIADRGQRLLEDSLNRPGKQAQSTWLLVGLGLLGGTLEEDLRESCRVGLDQRVRELLTHGTEFRHHGRQLLVQIAWSGENVAESHDTGLLRVVLH
jgi:hypothetical protein